MQLYLLLVLGAAVLHAHASTLSSEITTEPEPATQDDDGENDTSRKVIGSRYVLRMHYQQHQQQQHKKNIRQNRNDRIDAKEQIQKHKELYCIWPIYSGLHNEHHASRQGSVCVCVCAWVRRVPSY